MLEIKQVPDAKTEKSDKFDEGFKTVGNISFNEQEVTNEVVANEVPFGKKAQNWYSSAAEETSGIEPVDVGKVNSKPTDKISKYISGKYFILLIVGIVLVHIAFAIYIEASNKKPQFTADAKKSVTTVPPPMPAPVVAEKPAEEKLNTIATTTAQNKEMPAQVLPPIPQNDKFKPHGDPKILPEKTAKAVEVKDDKPQAPPSGKDQQNNDNRSIDEKRIMEILSKTK